MQIKGLKVTLEVAEGRECQHPGSPRWDEKRYTLNVTIPETQLGVQSIVDTRMREWHVMPQEVILEQLVRKMAASVEADIRTELLKAMRMGTHLTYRNT